MKTNKTLKVMKTSNTLCFMMVVVLSSFCQGWKNYKDLSEAVSKPDSVEWLTLRDQGLKSFPNEILEFKNLRYLDLSQNKIDSLPDKFGSLTELVFVDLSGNSIAELPASFSQSHCVEESIH
jgi:Leucine-rich repeat (LRR) protein